jgi:uncharacterized membrane protein
MIHGTVGAFVTPVATLLLALSRSLFQDHSLPYQALSAVLAAILAPAVWCIEQVLAASGVDGDRGMAYLAPIFGTLLAYLLLVGFLGGVAVGKLHQMRRSVQAQQRLRR